MCALCCVCMCIILSAVCFCFYFCCCFHLFCPRQLDCLPFNMHLARKWVCAVYMWVTSWEHSMRCFTDRWIVVLLLLLFYVCLCDCVDRLRCLQIGCKRQYVQVNNSSMVFIFFYSVQLHSNIINIIKDCVYNDI